MAHASRRALRAAVLRSEPIEHMFPLTSGIPESRPTADVKPGRRKRNPGRTSVQRVRPPLWSPSPSTECVKRSCSGRVSSCVVTSRVRRNVARPSSKRGTFRFIDGMRCAATRLLKRCARIVSANWPIRKCEAARTRLRRDVARRFADLDTIVAPAREQTNRADQVLVR